MNPEISHMLNQVDPERLKNTTLQFVEIPSPTTHERAFSEHYGEYLEKIGLDVELDDEFPDSPSVIARLRGVEPGRTLQLDGHTDTIPVPHSPPKFSDGLIYGRGVADMKSSLAAMAEAAEVLKRSGYPLKGDLLLTGHGLHEAPDGQNETLISLLKKGVHGDACIIGEIAHTFVPIVGKGQSAFEFVITREGRVIHETVADPDLPHPIKAGYELLKLLEKKHQEIQRDTMDYVGPESIFLGIFESGDFYNRVPTNCRIMGTRRFTTRRTSADIDREFNEILQDIRSRTRADVTLNLVHCGEAFELKEEEEVLVCLRGAYQAVTGRELPLGGVSIVGNSPLFINLARVPTVYHGVDTTTAHGDLEFVRLDDIVRAAKVYISAAIHFLS